MPYLLISLAGLVGLSLPLGVQATINLVVGGQFNASIIVLIALVLIGVILQGLIIYMQLRIAEDLQQRIYARSSFEFIYRFPKIKSQSLDGFYPPELANRFFDTMVIQKGLPKAIIDFSASLLQIVFGLILLLLLYIFNNGVCFVIKILFIYLIKFVVKSVLGTYTCTVQCTFLRFLKMFPFLVNYTGI